MTWEQHKPYLYLAFRRRGLELHYKNAATGVDPVQEQTGGRLVMVDAVAPYHAQLTRAMRDAYGRVPAASVATPGLIEPWMS